MIRIKQQISLVYSIAPSSHPLSVVHSTAHSTDHPICQVSILKHEKFVCKKPSLLGSRGCESWCDCDVVVVLHIYVSVSVVVSGEWCILSVWASPLSLYGFCLVGGNMDQVPGLEQYGCGGEGRPGRHTAAACQYTSSQHPSRPIFTTQFFCRPVAGEHFVPTGISIEWGSRGRVRVGCSC